MVAETFDLETIIKDIVEVLFWIQYNQSEESCADNMTPDLTQPPD